VQKNMSGGKDLEILLRSLEWHELKDVLEGALGSGITWKCLIDFACKNGNRKKVQEVLDKLGWYKKPQ